MDYERIQKPQGINGGFSPGKLRTMLMGVEKQRKNDDQLESAFTLRSQTFDLHESAFKDVDIVSVLPECSTTNTFEPEMIGDRRSKDNNNHNNGSIPSSRARNHNQDPPPDYRDDQTDPPSSNFEFQKGERVHHNHHQQRATIAPFSKPVRSKWDDAQKWIASPTSNRPTKSSAAPAQGRRVSRQSSTKVVLEVLSDPNPSLFEEPDTKQIDVSQERAESWAQKLLPWEMDAYNPTADSYSKPVLMIENSVGESAINLSRHSSSVAVQSSMPFMPPQSTARSVSMRDMGTEMTPTASQEPSRNGTPARATTPIRSPSSSRPPTPLRGGLEHSQATVVVRIDDSEVNRGLTEKELRVKTRREIMALGTQLGKTNIAAAWASKEEEDNNNNNDVSTSSFKALEAKNVIETRATAWEEAEKAKFMARFKREEMKIQAWENHQKAKTEAEMRKIEVEVERMRGKAHEKLMSKLASARHKAEEKRAAAEAKRNRQAAKTEQQAEYIRRTGRVPSLFSSCWTCCF